MWKGCINKTQPSSVKHRLGNRDAWALGYYCMQSGFADGGVCVSSLNQVRSCAKGYSLTPGGAAIGEEFLTAVCSHCHAAESSVIYSVIGA